MNNTILAVIAIIIVIGGGWFLLGNKAQAPTEEGAMQEQTSGEGTSAEENIGSQGSENGTSGSSRTSDSDASAGVAVSAMPVLGTNTSEMVVTSSPVTVTHTANGFSPKSVTVKKGTTVTFVNQGGGSMWVGSANHPDHTKYAGTTKSQHCPDTSGTAFDQCATGESYTFTFNQVGSWGYHNHVSASEWGTVIVTE